MLQFKFCQLNGNRRMRFKCANSISIFFGAKRPFIRKQYLMTDRELHKMESVPH
jgi:hypothetical protein